MAINVSWVKCGGNWCSLKHLNLKGVTATGVYIIWYDGNPGRVVRIGQGDIADRLSAHRKDSQITKYGDLKVTWASVPPYQRDGVERYLADLWTPLVGDAFPAVPPIEVNSPFG